MPTRQPSGGGFLLLDLFHTLVHGGDADRDRVIVEMGAVLGVDPHKLVRAFHESSRERLIAPDAEQTVRTLSARVGGSPSADQISAAAALRRNFSRRLLAAVSPATTTCLGQLRQRGWRLGLVSNATAETASAWPDSPLAGYFDAVTFSCQVGLAKPDPAIFRAALRRLAAPAATACIFIGDGGDGELAAAASLGMTVIRTTEHNDTDPSWPGRRIASLTQALGLLEEIERSPGRLG